jgi:hypothetical protein
MGTSDETRIGLCATCRNARVVQTPRSTFWMCQLSSTDPRFDKYPRLPVLECSGFEPLEPEVRSPRNGGATGGR